MNSNHSSLTGSLFALALTFFCCLPAASQIGGPGTAVSLNGTTNAWLNVPNGTWFSGNFTVEAWVNVNSYNSWSRLIDFSDGPNNYNVYLALTDGTLGYPTMGVFTNNDSSPVFSSGIQLPTNQWVHLAATGNGTNGTIYLNGTPVGTGMLNIAPNIIRTINYIGGSPNATNANANANFDELSIWNVARTQVQLQTSMNHPLVGNESGLAGYWRFDEGSGTNAFDSSGNGNTATLNSGVSWTNSTAPLTNAADYALSFNGAQLVTIPHQAAQDSYPFTVMCWFMEPTNSPGGGALVGNYFSSSYNGWQLAIGGQLYAWYYRDISDYVGNTGAGAVNDGLWHHAAFVVDSTGGIVYLDGVPKQTNAWVGTAGPCSTAEAAFLGIYQGNSLLDGDVDEVSIWNVALTQSQIQTYMHQPLQGTETGLVNYYRMNEGIGTNIYDYTTNADTGNLSPSPPTWIISGAQIQEPPQVTTLPATVIENSAALSGTIDPQGLNSSSWFRWGLTTAYGNVTAPNTFAAGYTISTNIITLNNLSVGTYHCQIVAANSSGTNYGADQSFTITTQFELGSTNLLEGPVAGTDSVVLAASPTNAFWFATANAPWLRALNSSGTGSSNVIFGFATNSGATRTGTLTIAGQTLTVTQAGSNYVAAPEPATVVVASPLVDPYAVALDNAGNAYIADAGTGDVLEWVKTNNTVVTLFYEPYASIGVSVDSKGNVYFCEVDNNSILEWSAVNKNVTTVIGSGLNGPYGLAVDSVGNVYIADTGDNAIKEWVAATSNLVTLVSTGLSAPRSVAVDIAGNVYIADSGDDMLKEWSPVTGKVTVLASESDGLGNSQNLAVDGSGNVYSSDGFGIQKWSPSLRAISMAAFLDLEPIGVGVDGAGNIFIADNYNYPGALKVLPHAFFSVPTVKSEPYIAGNDTLPAMVLPTNALQFVPTSDQSWLTIAGVSNDVTSFSFTANTTGAPRTAHINFLGEPVVINQSAVILGTTNLLEGPVAGIDSVMLVVPPPFLPLSASANADWLHVASAYQPATNGTNIIFTFDANPGSTRTGVINIANQTIFVTQAGAPYVLAPAQLTTLASGLGFSTPTSLAVDSAGNVYIADTSNHAIKEWDLANNSVTTLVSGFSRPTSVAVDKVDNLLFFADADSNAVYLCALPDPRVLPLITSGLNGPTSIALDGSDNVYIADSGASVLKRWNFNDGSISLLASNLFLEGITLDTAGDVYFASAAGNIEEWVAATGNVITNISGLSGYDLAVDGSGNIYIADGSGLQKWTAATGTLTTLIAGIYNGVAVDSADNLYIAAVEYNAVGELPRAFLDPAARFEPGSAGNDALPVILPASVNLLPPFNPTSSDPLWLTVTNTGGVVSFSFTPNIGPPSASPRTARLDVLGQIISVTQTSAPVLPPQFTSELMLPNHTFQFTFTSTPDTSFTILATTNLALPLSNWVNQGTFLSIGPGIYQYDSPPITSSQEFYEVVWP